jgi:hypothetical protein
MSHVESAPTGRRLAIAAPAPAAHARTARARAWPAALAHASLLALVGAVGFIAASSASGDAIIDTASAPEPSWVAGPLRGIVPAITPDGFGVAMLVALVAYAVAIALAHHLLPGRLWSAIVLANVLVLLAPPLLSSDVFGYIAYARLGVVHGLNPYVHPPSAAPAESVFPLVYWQGQTSPYGPLFTLLSYPLGLVGAVAALWALKAAATAACIATARVVWRHAGRLGVDRTRATALLALNPLLLVYAAGGAHNDPLVMLLTTAGIVALAPIRRGRARHPIAGMGALVAAAATKVTGAVALPFALAASRRDRATLAAAAAIAALAAALALAVFGTHLLDQVSAISSGADYLNDYSGPQLLAHLLGTDVGAPIHAAGIAFVGSVALWQLVRTLRGASWIAAAGWTTLAALLAVPSLAPWYVCWLLPFAALHEGRALRWATLLFTVALVLGYVPLIAPSAAP